MARMVCMQDGCEWLNGQVCSQPCRQARRIPPGNWTGFPFYPCTFCAKTLCRINFKLCPHYREHMHTAWGQLRVFYRGKTGEAGSGKAAE